MNRQSRSRRNSDHILVAAVGLDTALRTEVRRICHANGEFSYSGHVQPCGPFLPVLAARKPRLVLIDDERLNGNRLGILVRLHQALPEARTLLIGDTLEIRAMSQTLHAGVWGVLARERAAEDLQYAMLAVARGELWLSRGQLSRLLMLDTTAEPTTELFELTPRENSVMRGVLSGRSNKEIARMLDIAEHTVKSTCTTSSASFICTDASTCSCDSVGVSCSRPLRST